MYHNHETTLANLNFQAGRSLCLSKLLRHSDLGSNDQSSTCGWSCTSPQRSAMPRKGWFGYHLHLSQHFLPLEVANSYCDIVRNRLQHQQWCCRVCFDCKCIPPCFLPMEWDNHGLAIPGPWNRFHQLANSLHSPGSNAWSCHLPRNGLQYGDWQHLRHQPHGDRKASLWRSECFGISPTCLKMNPYWHRWSSHGQLGKCYRSIGRTMQHHLQPRWKSQKTWLFHNIPLHCSLWRCVNKVCRILNIQDKFLHKLIPSHNPDLHLPRATSRYCC